MEIFCIILQQTYYLTMSDKLIYNYKFPGLPENNHDPLEL